MWMLLCFITQEFVPSAIEVSFYLRGACNSSRLHLSSVFGSPPFVSANYYLYRSFLSSREQLRFRLFTPAAHNVPPAPLFPSAWTKRVWTGHQTRLDTDHREEHGVNDGRELGGQGPSVLTELWRRWADSQSNSIKTWSSPRLHVLSAFLISGCFFPFRKG